MYYQIISVPFGESHIHEYHLTHNSLCPWSCCMILSTLSILWSTKQQSLWLLPLVRRYCNSHLVWWNLSNIHGYVVFNVFSQLITISPVCISVCVCPCMLPTICVVNGDPSLVVTVIQLGLEAMGSSPAKFCWWVECNTIWQQMWSCHGDNMPSIYLPINRSH